MYMFITLSAVVGGTFVFVIKFDAPKNEDIEIAIKRNFY